jgi:hypothetical protein
VTAIQKSVIEIQVDEQGFIRLAPNSRGQLEPKKSYRLEVDEPSYRAVGSRYESLSPEERAADFRALMEQWRNDPHRPRVALTDDQLKREHIYED